MLRNVTKRLEMRLRANAPSFIRHLYRIIRSGGTVHLSKSLPPELLESCRFCASRDDLLDLLPRGGRVAELGTYKGNFARNILARAVPLELNVIDVDYSLFDKTLLEDNRLVCHTGLTHVVISLFDNDYFDWVYIDADHSYEGVLRDARASANKIKPGGFVVFNDFAHIDPFLGRYGVHRAVTDFSLETGWPFYFFCFDRAGLYDVALRRPL